MRNPHRVLLLALATPTLALAAAPPRGPAGETGLILAGEAPPPPAARQTFVVPSRARTAWDHFRELRGPAWRAYFDQDTGVPGRIYGGFVAAPGSSRSPEIALEAARDVLARHLALLAPGAELEDFAPAANRLAGDVRVVSFFQQRRGMPVEGGQLSFRFKKDRLFVVASEAWPDVTAERPARTVSEERARQSARSWLAQELGLAVEAGRVRGPLVLPIPASADGERGPGSRTVLAVRVDSRRPVGRWAVYLDATSGEPVARRQTLMFASGSLGMNTPERWPGGQRADAPAAGVSVSGAGRAMETDGVGLLTWPEDHGMSVTFGAAGPLVRVLNEAGAPATVTASLAAGGRFVWNAANDELVDAQLTTYVASQVVKAKARSIAPDLAWLTSDQLQATVNIADVCNAFSDGDTVNFFRAGADCENTGRLPDVVYHEFGHALHFHSLIPGAGRFDSAFSEGLADYLAADITGDPGMGRGFFYDERPLRELDPEGGERVWPDDVARDPHETGLIFAGAMWDLRKALVAELGPAAGAAEALRLYYAAVQRAADIPSTYVEILTADDDDGDLGNGTPRLCTIADAFGKHGLGDPALGGPGIGSPVREGLTVKVPIAGESACPGNDLASATVTWELRGQAGSGGTLELVRSAAGFEATIPAEGTEIVVRYRLDLALANGTAFGYPDNAADPMYEVYLGPLVPIYCTDLEGDPSLDGWVHELVAGDPSVPDDWEHGTPQGLSGSGDPSFARSGEWVYGTDLGLPGANGRYQGSRTILLRAPIIDVSGYVGVRLQYWRWLTVQDGFYDHARIRANGTEVWSNKGTMQFGTLHHLDTEWRFHDVDLTPAVVDGQVEVGFELESDRRRSYGGWNVDDFCIMGVQPAVCGNGVREAGEACDDGNTTRADGCEADCTPSPPAVCGNGLRELGEACDDGNPTAGDGCEPGCALTPPAVCGNGVREQGEACDDGRLDGTACAPGCVLPTPLETVDSGCGCTSAAPAEPSLLLLFLLGLTLARRSRR